MSTVMTWPERLEKVTPVVSLADQPKVTLPVTGWNLPSRQAALNSACVPQGSIAGAEGSHAAGTRVMYLMRLVGGMSVEKSLPLFAYTTPFTRALK